MSLKTIVNGIDVGRLRDAGGDSPLRAEVTATTEWLGGTQTRTLTAAAWRPPAREFAIHTDYPDAFVGSGTAPSPDDLFVTALASSFLTSFVLAAAAANVRIESMRVVATCAALERRESSSGDVQLCGDVDADASPADLEQLCALALEDSSIFSACGFDVRVVLGEVNMSVAREANASEIGVGR